MAIKVLNKAIKEELAEIGFNRLFQKRMKDLAWDIYDLAEAMMDDDAELVQVRAIRAGLPPKLNDFLGICTENYASDCITLKKGKETLRVGLPAFTVFGAVRCGVIINPRTRKTEFSQYYSRLHILPRGGCSFRTEHCQFIGDVMDVDEGISVKYWAAAEQIVDRVEKLKIDVSALTALLESVKTPKQLQEISPDLFALLPSQTVKHTLMVPAEALCTINELLKQSA